MGLDLRVELIAEPEDTLRISESDDARVRQRDATAGPIEQARIEVILELLDLKRNSGLGHAQRVRRLREGSVFRDSAKSLESTVPHAGHFLDAEI